MEGNTGYKDDLTEVYRYDSDVANSPQALARRRRLAPRSEQNAWRGNGRARDLQAGIETAISVSDVRCHQPKGAEDKNTSLEM